MPPPGPLKSTSMPLGEDRKRRKVTEAATGTGKYTRRTVRTHRYRKSQTAQTACEVACAVQT